MSSLVFGGAAHAAKLEIGRVDQPPAHTCEIEDIEVEARFDNQPSRVILTLKNPRTSSYVACPKHAWIPTSGRDEALRLFEILRDAKESSCLVSGAVTSTRNALHCDAGFNVQK